MASVTDKKWFIGIKCNPFICNEVPFVCHESPCSIPFICIYRPSVRNAKISSVGFTLLEVLITLAIVAILAGAGIPAMGTIIRNHRITTQTNDLIADLNLARSEAIKRGGTVIVCATVAGGGTCAAAGATDFREGRLIFVDANANGVFDAGDQMLRQREILVGASNTLNVLNPGTSPIVFSNPGRVTQGLNGVAQINFAICIDMDFRVGRQVQLGISGQVRLLKSGDVGYLGQCA